MTPSGTSLDVKIEQLGGVLNSVYLLKYHRNHEEKKVVVKRFKDWFGLKWFPLSLWTLGTKSFAVLGRTRLEREYSMNQFLRNHGFPVPKVLDISHQERLIFEDFVEGETMVKTIKRIILSRAKATEDDALVREVGRKVAEAHRLGVALGDCKPENIVVAEDGKTYFVDLEQATRNGNQVWDVAEFLYYSGHYVLPISPSGPAELIAREFIGGYLEAGGERETVKSAASARYTKVFSIFTPLHVLLAISNVCKKMSEA
jgi:tRNA A-37 threonylcarbamoyl transferase component Bud32